MCLVMRDLKVEYAGAVAATYIFAGIVLATGAYLNGHFSRARKPLMPLLLVVFLWPIIVLFEPTNFIFTKRIRRIYDSSRLANGLKEAISGRPGLSEEELSHIQRVVEGGEESVAYIAYNGAEALACFFKTGIPPSVQADVRSAQGKIEAKDSLKEQSQSKSAAERSVTRFKLAGPDWYIGFSDEFLKCVSGIDRKMQGRVLEAISRISNAPTTNVGNTVKALTAGLSGLWRFRIGDYRLVYFADPKSKQVTLLSFGPRSSVYANVPSTSDLKG